jgi:hypothetical protein
MRSPLNALRPWAEQETEKAREALALEAFSLDKVKAAVIDAAKRGESATKLGQGGAAVNLASTKAAQALQAWAEQNGFKVEWAERLADRPNGLKAGVAEPVISWGDERLG